MRSTVAALAVALSLLSLAAPALAQRGDRKGHDMKEVWRDMNVPPSPVRAAEEELATFKLAPGFRAELVAAEPMVETPVAMAWDPQGRLWVVEMRGYMPNVDGAGEYESNDGRVSVLEDLDGDGRMDKVTRFLEGLKLPRSISFVEGGVLIGEPKNLYFCQDLNGDLKCDKKTRIADYALLEPIETTNNGLMRAIDNWIYDAKSTKRYQWKSGQLVEEKTASRGQWGIAQDDYGRLYFNTNEQPFIVDLFPAEYYLRNPRVTSPKALAFRTGNIEVFPIRPNPGVNRGYMTDFLRPDGTLRRFTAASSVLIYRGDQYPDEFYGNAFVPAPCGNLLKRLLVEKSGPEIRPALAYPDSEFLASTDERFRPVTAYNAPDGCVYVCDIYHGILQHKIYMTSFLRKQIIERGLDKPGMGLGRIWRIVHEGKKPAGKPNLAAAPSAELVATLNHRNGWWRDTAQRLLVERRDSSVIEPLKSLAVQGESDVARIHALWTLQGLGALDKATFLAASRDAYPQVRAAALRVGESLLPTGDAPAVVARFVDMTRGEDQSVRIQAALSLGSSSGEARVRAAIADLLAAYGDDLHLRQAVLASLGGNETAMLTELLASPAWATNRLGAAEVLADLASTTFRIDAKAAAAVIDSAAAQSGAQEWRQIALLNGVLDATKKQKRIKLAAEPRPLLALAESKNKLVSKRAKDSLAALTWPGDKKAAADKPRVFTAAEKAVIEQGRAGYMTICFACHQVHGGGQPGLAPPLADSEWVTGSPDRLIRIVLQGVQGPITVNDEEWNLIMPGLLGNPLLSTDESVAAVLSYIRNEWGNSGSIVTPEMVKKVREATAGRVDPWKVEELLKIK